MKRVNVSSGWLVLSWHEEWGRSVKPQVEVSEGTTLTLPFIFLKTRARCGEGLLFETGDMRSTLKLYS